MKIATILAAATVAAASSAALAQAPLAQDAGSSAAGSCLAEVRAIEADRVGPAGPGEVNEGMQAAQEQEARRLQEVARAQAQAGDATACRRTLGTLKDLVAENRQQLPTQQDLATGQPGSPALKDAVEE
ncbi:hypothetical protein [Azospirillum sp. ST 5-10]|uniref:hypothetical protein n=1 Tax=unclassified Azospirillum TaxID=2630922 RepID=UPI003F4A30C8